MWNAKSFEDVRNYADQGRNKNDRPWVRGGKNSRLQKRGDNYALRLYQTDVVTFTPDGLILNSGGYRTRTTKTRINEALHGFMRGVGLFQEKGVWYLSSKTTPFIEGVLVGWDGVVQNIDAKTANAEIERVQRLTKQINSYAKAIADKLVTGALDQPGPGDCLLCLVDGDAIVNSKPFVGGGHLESHLGESYYVPSLIINAFRVGGYSDYTLAMVYSYFKGSETSAFKQNSSWDNSTRDWVIRAMRAYLKQRLEIAR